MKLDDILARVRREHHWTVTQAREAKLWYRRFLWLSYQSKFSRTYAISKKSDELWHGHIVFTQRYRDDCDEVFQRFLDHTPGAGGPRKPRGLQLKRAKAPYETAFGSAPPDIQMPCYLSPIGPHH